MPAPRWVRSFIQPIAVRDVLHYLVAAADVPRRGEPGVRHRRPRRHPLRPAHERLRGRGRAAAASDRGAAGAHAVARRPVGQPRHARSRARSRVPIIESLQFDCVMREHDIDDVIPPPDGGPAAVPHARCGWRSSASATGEVETSWRNAEVGRRAERSAAERPRLGRSHGVRRRARATDSTRDAGDAVARRSRASAARTAGTRSRSRGRCAAGSTSSSAVSGLRRGRRDPDDAPRRRRRRLLAGRGASTAARSCGCAPRCGCRAGPGSSSAASEAAGRRLRLPQRAVFFPKGLAGRLYWWAILPFHGIIFAGMANRITAEAEAEGGPNAHEKKVTKR